MDFVADQLADGRKIRTLTIIDLFIRECLGIEVGFRLRAEHVVAAMNRMQHDRGLPQRITTDNGSEFSGSQMDLWAFKGWLGRSLQRSNALAHARVWLRGRLVQCRSHVH